MIENARRHGIGGGSGEAVVNEGHDQGVERGDQGARDDRAQPVAQRVRGEPLRGLLGAYSVVGEGHYDLSAVAHYWLWHLEELTLYVAIVPVAVLVILLARSRRLPPRLQEHLAVTCASVLWGSIVVAAFASRFASDRVQDRPRDRRPPGLGAAQLGEASNSGLRPEQSLTRRHPRSLNPRIRK